MRIERLRMLSDDAAMVKAAMDFVALYGGPVRPPPRNFTSEGREQLSATLDDLNVPRVNQELEYETPQEENCNAHR